MEKLQLGDEGPRRTPKSNLGSWGFLGGKRFKTLKNITRLVRFKKKKKLPRPWGPNVWRDGGESSCSQRPSFGYSG